MFDYFFFQAIPCDNSIRFRQFTYLLYMFTDYSNIQYQAILTNLVTMGSIWNERKIEESPTLCTMVILCDEAQSCSTPHHKRRMMVWWLLKKRKLIPSKSL